MHILPFNERFTTSILTYWESKESTRYQFTMPNQFHVCELLEQYAISIQFSARIKRKRVFALAVLVLLTLNYTSECLALIRGRSSPPQRRSSSKNIWRTSQTQLQLQCGLRRIGSVTRPSDCFAQTLAEWHPVSESSWKEKLKTKHQGKQD